MRLSDLMHSCWNSEGLLNWRSDRYTYPLRHFNRHNLAWKKNEKKVFRTYLVGDASLETLGRLRAMKSGSAGLPQSPIPRTVHEKKSFVVIWRHPVIWLVLKPAGGNIGRLVYDIVSYFETRTELVWPYDQLLFFSNQDLGQDFIERFFFSHGIVIPGLCGQEILDPRGGRKRKMSL